jgi:Tetratricopeptide repeat/NB-ARC domain
MTEEPQPAEPVEAFFSYAHEDDDLRRGLEQHFSFLRREGKTVHWHDRELKAGEDLTQNPPRLTVLWGEGGVGKTTIAAETTRALDGVFGERIVWANAEKRADFTFPTLLNEIATQLGQADLAKLATGPKEQAVRRLLANAPTLVILDNFETVAPDDKAPCANFLATRAQCPALITTQERVAHDAARRFINESLEIKKRLGDQSGTAFSLLGLGVLASEAGDKIEAARLMREALHIFEKLGSSYAETARRNLALIEST